MKAFFSDPYRLRNIESFIKGKHEYNTHIRSEKIKLLVKDSLQSISKNAKHWDLNCELNSSNPGVIEKFDSILDEDFLISISEESAETMLVILYRFMIELKFAREGDYFFELGETERYIQRFRTTFSDSNMGVIDWTERIMPIEILRNLIFSNDLKSIRTDLDKMDKVQQRINEWQSSADEKIDLWDKELQAKETRARELSNNLDDHRKSINFVGLNEGFLNLHKQKSMALKSQLKSLKQIGIGIVSLLFLEILLGLSDVIPSNTGMIKYIIPIISLLLIMIYFFRVVLQNYKSTQSQIMQLDLRMTLCQFIQSYAEYAQEIKEKDPEALSKFENIIFSSIVADDEKIPSTFDGLDQLTQLLGTVKKS